jgi:hypothetical protein
LRQHDENPGVVRLSLFVRVCKVRFSVVLACISFNYFLEALHLLSKFMLFFVLIVVLIQLVWSFQPAYKQYGWPQFSIKSVNVPQVGDTFLAEVDDVVGTLKEPAVSFMVG